MSNANRESHIDRRLSRSNLQNHNEYITAPEDVMQIDLVPELPPYGGYENVVTDMDVFSRCLSGYSTSNQIAKTFAKVIIKIMNKHAYLPALISDNRSAIVSLVIQLVAGVLRNILKHATTKSTQKIGMLRQSLASIKQALKFEAGQRKSLWFEYVRIAIFKYNTSYHANISSEPSRAFHGRLSYNFLDLKLGVCPQEAPITI